MNIPSHLQKIGTHTWVYTFDTEKDRPNLGYIRGTDMALAVDAGHSSSHVQDFYGALERELLPLPDLTVITHWHWDHTFGMHAVHGKTMARPETNRRLREIRREMREDPDYARRFLQSDSCIRKEYAGGVPLIVVPADEEVPDGFEIKLGGVTARLLPNPRIRKTVFWSMCRKIRFSISETRSLGNFLPGVWITGSWLPWQTGSGGWM